MHPCSHAWRLVSSTTHVLCLSTLFMGRHSTGTMTHEELKTDLKPEQAASSSRAPRRWAYRASRSVALWAATMDVHSSPNCIWFCAWAAAILAIAGRAVWYLPSDFVVSLQPVPVVGRSAPATTWFTTHLRTKTWIEHLVTFQLVPEWELSDSFCRRFFRLSCTISTTFNGRLSSCRATWVGSG